jgi:hypothetical protein
MTHVEPPNLPEHNKVRQPELFNVWQSRSASLYPRRTIMRRFPAELRHWPAWAASDGSRTSLNSGHNEYPTAEADRGVVAEKKKGTS